MALTHVALSGGRPRRAINARPGIGLDRDTLPTGSSPNRIGNSASRSSSSAGRDRWLDLRRSRWSPAAARASAPPAWRTFAAGGARVGVLDLDPGRSTVGRRVTVAGPTWPTGRRWTRPSARSPRRSAASTSSSTAPASAPSATVEDNDDEEWARVLDVNVTGVARAVPGGPAVPAPQPASPRSSTCPRSRPTAGLVQTRAVLGVQGSRARAHPRHGRRPGHGGHPGQLRRPRHRRHALGRPACSPAPPTRRRRSAHSPPASRPADWSPPTEVAAAVAYLASPRRRCHHRNVPGGRRRHVRPAPAPLLSTARRRGVAPRHRRLCRRRPPEGVASTGSAQAA